MLQVLSLTETTNCFNTFDADEEYNALAKLLMDVQLVPVHLLISVAHNRHKELTIPEATSVPRHPHHHVIPKLSPPLPYPQPKYFQLLCNDLLITMHPSVVPVYGTYGYHYNLVVHKFKRK